MYNQCKEYALGKTRLRVQVGYKLLKCSFLAMGCDKMNKMYFEVPQRTLITAAVIITTPC